MHSLIVVHPDFDGVWPFTADHFHELWARQTPVDFIRLGHEDRRPLGPVLKGPGTAPHDYRRMAVLGVTVTPECLERMDQLREAVIASPYGSGASAELRELLKQRGARLYEQPTEGFWGQSVAEFALGLTICAMRRIPQLYRHMMHSQGVWNHEPRGGIGAAGQRGQQFADDPRFVCGTIEGKRVRVAGMGNIGSRYASFTHALGAEVAAWDPVAPEPCFHRSGARKVWRLAELVRDAQVFAPMLPLVEKTHGAVSRALVEALPRGCLVVLVTRAGIVDMKALRQRVLADELALAADVFDIEPLPLDDPLLARGNVVHTPHLAGRTREANLRWAEALAAQFEPAETLDWAFMAALTRKQVREVDRRAIEDLGLPGAVLMENAGRNTAAVALQRLWQGDAAPHLRVGVLCGGGNNGGDGYVIARHLHNAGVAVTLYPAVDPGSLKGDALINATVALRMDLPFNFIRDAEELRRGTRGWPEADLMVDALLGTGSHGQVRPHLAEVIRLCNSARGEPLVRSQGTKVLAVDVPSGLDCDTGEPANATIEADITVTFMAEKVGFANPSARRYLGKLVVVDIGTPPSLTQRVLREVRE